MCFGGGTPSPPPPPPLPPAPPPPLPPVKPPPPPDPMEKEVNPQVKRAKSEKSKNPFTKGTSALRIKLDPTVNTGQNAGPGGGLNV